MFKLVISIVAVIFLVPIVLAQNRATIRYYASTNSCSGSGLQCTNIPPLDCCEAPPSPTSFHTTKAIAGFAPCIQLFFNNDGHGGCSTCSSGGSCDTCYYIQNNPFTPAAWYGINSCRARDSAVAGMASQGNSITCHEVSEAFTASGLVYSVPKASTGLKDVFVEDFISLPSEEFHAKWSNSYLRTEAPATAGSSAIAVNPKDLSEK